jgi:nucleotide-binding universal stress UspA family protein
MSSGVIVGYDGSDYAKTALQAALDAAKAYGDPVIVAFGYELNKVAGEIQDYAAALKEVARQRLDEAREVAADHDSGVEVDAVIVEEAPAKALAELAEERDARLIVIGSRGESPIRGALLGSTAHKLLHLSSRPVLVVPAGR